MAGIRATRVLICLSIVVLALPLLAQQTGALSGRVTAVDGSALPGVTVEARSNVLPQPRVTTTTGTGDYRLPALPPGAYTLTFSLAGMETRTRNVQVLLQQDQTVNVSLGIGGLAESITVTAAATLIDPQSAEIKSALPESTIQELPVGQEYRDLVKLLPAVQYSEDTIRGPSAGGSGQDNVYQFDGVNVTLPLFGTLSAEPSSHDIAQLSVMKGGARAVDFNRSAGFTIDSVSKSGTNEFAGEVSYRLESDAMRGDVTGASVSQFDQTRSWATFNIGGPILRESLFFYGSYYRPEVERTGRSNVYGILPDYDSKRDEFFGKLTFTPTASILINGSYRDSSRDVTNASIGGTSAPSTALNEEASQKIAILEASWVATQRSFVTFKYTDYLNETASLPLNRVSAVPSNAPGTRLDINNLDALGSLTVPAPVTGQTAYNAFIVPLIQRYGYINAAGARVGGGFVGAGSQINDQDFFRESAQLAYDFTLGSRLTHDLHVGVQRSKDGEDLARVSNGWGLITVPGGRVNFQGQPVFYQAQFSRPIGGVAGDLGAINIRSEYRTLSFEVNDTIRWNDWSFNVGMMASQDSLYGQGLRNDSSALSGFVTAPGNQYKMYEIKFKDTLQPRLGVTWLYNSEDSVYTSYSRYVPAASSLPRAASWDRNTLGLTTRVHFDVNGNIIGSEQVGGSAGKLFQEGMDPRYTDEYMIGTSQQINNRWVTRAYGRYRYSTNFWEDTQNNARQLWAPEGYPKDLYIPNLIQQLQQIQGSGNNNAYVIAQLDGAFTKYYEATLESDWRGGNTFLRGSYTWSHYYGNFDQDNTTTVNDAAVFIGSSFVADGPGRQIWDNRYGDLRGDRRHLLKVISTYSLPWRATLGAFGLYQSGQPWEAWSYLPYVGLPGFGTSTSDASRFAEPAGSRRTDGHYQVDLSYTQNIPFGRYNFQVELDAFNVTDNQTGYNPQPSMQSALFGVPRDFYDPRRYLVTARFQF
jgi:hypothetical protein